MTGLFLVLEGIDGSGTTTQAHRLVEKFTAQGAVARMTFEPSKGAIGTMTRGYLRSGAGGDALDPAALALLFAADRLEHLQRDVLPSLARGEVIICDRYLLSSLAYQGSFLDVEWVAALNARAPAPDITLFVDVDVEVAAGRRAQRGGVADQYEVDEVQRKVAANYRTFSGRPGLGRVVRVDGNGPMDAVTDVLWQHALTAWQALPRR